MFSSVPAAENSSKVTPAVGLPTSFEDFVQQEQKRLQTQQGDKKLNVAQYLKSEISKNIPAKKPRKEYSSTAASALAEAVAMTNANNSSSVVKSEPTEEEVNAAMPADVPTGNSKEDRKKRRLIRNRVSAQLHRERKKKYIASLEEKVRDQCQQLGRMNTLIQNLGVENRRLLDMAANNVCPSCASSGSDSSMPYSPMSDTTEDDVDPTVDEIPVGDSARLKDEIVLPEEEVMGDMNEYADSLFKNVDLGDGDEFDFGMWGEDVLDSNTGLDTPSHSGAGSSKRKFAFLFGVFFMTALFGSSILTSPQNSRVLMLMLNTPPAAMPAVSAAVAAVPLSRHRRRSLLSVSPSGKDSALAKDVEGDSKALSLWKDIMHDMVPLKQGAFTGSPQDVKNLICAIENISTPVEERAPVQVPLLKKRLRRTQQEKSENTADTTLVRFNAAEKSLNLHGIHTDGNLVPANASFLLCPKPYGSMAQQNDGADANLDVLMYDNVKVNRDVVLFMPSSSVGIKNPPATWDGKWIQVNAIIESIRTAPGLSGMKAIASSSL